MVRPDAPPSTSPDPCVTNPQAPNCTPPSNGGGSSDSTTYSSPRDNILVPTGVQDAHKAGFTGKGVKVAILDTGARASLAPLQGKDFHFLDLDGSASAGVDTGGHGSVMAMVLGGNVTADYTGGVAPDADLYISRICTDTQSCSYSSTDFDKRMDQGVRLFNASWGSRMPSPDGTAATENDREQIASTIRGVTINAVNNGALLVFPTGNKDGNFGGSKMDYSNPDGLQTDTSLAPHWFPELQKGWLAVTNVAIDGDQWNTTAGKVTGLSDTAVACNEAANWCLAAPGFVQTVPVPGTAFGDNAYAVGTSNSTAIVTGVAALVWQAFPWMSADNVRQTILTTATHLGGGAADKPNATYGWGLVNAGKAVLGPSKFDAAIFGDFVADTGASAAIFDNAISGDGGLVVRGSAGGMLDLRADNTYTGATTIESGRLDVDGSITSNVAVLHGAILTGQGTVRGSVNNDGQVASFGDDAGQGFAITGDYTATSQATTSVAPGTPLTIGGTASLAGALEILKVPTRYTPKSTETIINAGHVQGVFDSSFSTGEFYAASLHYADTAVTADLTRTSVASSQAASVTPVTQHAAQGVEGALTQADQWSETDYAGHKAFLDHAAMFLSAQTQSAAVSSLSSIGGEVYGTLTAIEAAQSQHIDNDIALRQNGVDHGRFAVWAQSFTDNGGIAQEGFASASYRGNGWLTGVDIPVATNATFGLFAGEYRMVADMAALAGRVDGRNKVAGAYGRIDFASGTYAAARVSWDRAQIDVRRTLDLGGSLFPASGGRTDGIGRATFEIGQSAGAFTPYVSATYLRFNSAGFSESGDSGFELTSRAQDRDATLASVGLRYATSFTWGGGESALTAYGSFQHVLTGASTEFAAALTGAPEARFMAIGQQLTPNLTRVGVMLDTRINARLDWYLNAEAEGASRRAHGFGANAGVRVRF